MSKSDIVCRSCDNNCQHLSLWDLCPPTNLKNLVNFESKHLLRPDWLNFQDFGIWCFLLHYTSMMKLSTASLWPESRVFNNLSWQGYLESWHVHLPCHNPQLVVIILVANLDKSFVNNLNFVIGLNQRQFPKESIFRCASISWKGMSAAVFFSWDIGSKGL